MTLLVESQRFAGSTDRTDLIRALLNRHPIEMFGGVIADCRRAEESYLGNAEDRARAGALMELVQSEHFDFEELIERLYDLSPEVGPEARRRQTSHLRTTEARAEIWLEALGRDTAGLGPRLDLGCGSGGFLVASARREPELIHVGIDPALRWLTVAAGRLKAAGLDGGRVCLVAAHAEELPFDAETFGSVAAGDVIEHVNDQARTLAEVWRVLKPGGRLFLASPNRLSLTPEPHVLVWGVGWLPETWRAAYVRCVNGAEYRQIRNLSWNEWQRLLNHSPFGGGRVEAPRLATAELREFGGLKRGLGTLYNLLVTHGFGQFLARRVGPCFHVVCQKR